MINYDLDILNLEVYSQHGQYQQYVHKINWQLTARDDEHAVSSTGQTELSLSESVEDYCDFDQLTREQVVNWVYQNDREKLQSMQNFLNIELDLVRSPSKVVLDPPWSS